jgi:hypothetical protein
MPRQTLSNAHANAFRPGGTGPVNTFRFPAPVEGSYRLMLQGLSGNGMSIQFLPEGITSGTAELSIDGEYGSGSTVDLASSRMKTPNFVSGFIDVDFTGVNPEGSLTIKVM